MSVEFASTTARIEENLERVIRGKPEAIRLVLIALLAGGHILLEDVPGTGKTTLAKSLARSIDGTFRRVQFTPDLLPADAVGPAGGDERGAGLRRGDPARAAAAVLRRGHAEPDRVPRHLSAAGG